MVIAFAASCSLINPHNDSGLTIQVSDASFSSQGKFTATVGFTNNLGRDVDIIYVGCMSTDSTFTPDFLMEHFVNAEWDTFGGPMCPEIYIPPTKLSNGKSFTTIVVMLADTVVSGTFRLWFDIREQDITKQIPQEYLMSNAFAISK